MLSDRDYELLSAYLDGALTEGERGALEARLSSEAGLQRELETLRATVDLIHGLPPLKAPRNFTLDARMVRPAGRVSFLTSTAFSALSAAAAFVLIAGAVVLGLVSPMPQASPAQFAVDQASQSEVASAPTIFLTPTPVSSSSTLAAEEELFATPSPQTLDAFIPQGTPTPALETGLAGMGGEGVDEQQAADAALAPAATQPLPGAVLMAPLAAPSVTPVVLFASPENFALSQPAEAGSPPVAANNDLLPQTQISEPLIVTQEVFSAVGAMAEEAALAITATSEADGSQRQELSPAPLYAFQPVAARQTPAGAGVPVSVILLVGGVVLLAAAVLSTVVRRRSR